VGVFGITPHPSPPPQGGGRDKNVASPPHYDTLSESLSQRGHTMADKVRVAIVGLGFGAEFIPIYQAHPNAEMYAICRRDKTELDKVGDRYGIKTRYTPIMPSC